MPPIPPLRKHAETMPNHPLPQSPVPQSVQQQQQQQSQRPLPHPKKQRAPHQTHERSFSDSNLDGSDGILASHDEITATLSISHHHYDEKGPNNNNNGSNSTITSDGDEEEEEDIEVNNALAARLQKKIARRVKSVVIRSKGILKLQQILTTLINCRSQGGYTFLI